MKRFVLPICLILGLGLSGCNERDKGIPADDVYICKDLSLGDMEFKVSNTGGLYRNHDTYYDIYTEYRGGIKTCIIGYFNLSNYDVTDIHTSIASQFGIAETLKGTIDSSKYDINYTVYSDKGLEILDLCVIDSNNCYTLSTLKGSKLSSEVLELFGSYFGISGTTF